MSTASKILTVGGGALATNRLPIDCLLAVDGSASIQGNRDRGIPSLVAPLLGFADKIEQGLAAIPRSRIQRVIFHGSRIEVDRGMISLDRAARISLAEFYAADGETTALDMIVKTELRRLYERFDAAPKRLHMALVVTDGENREEDALGSIHRRMERVLDRANRCGGILRTRIFFGYVGVGLTREVHEQQASARYRIPKEWTIWVPGTVQAIKQVGDEISNTMTGFSQGSRTMF